MLNYSAIYDLCEMRKMKVKELCSYIGISYQGIKTSLNTGKLSGDKIDSLCRCLKITPNHFFMWSENGDIPSVENTQYGIMNNQNVNTVGVDLLQRQLEEKDRQIATKDSQIEKLLNLLNNK